MEHRAHDRNGVAGAVRPSSGSRKFQSPGGLEVVGLAAELMQGMSAASAGELGIDMDANDVDRTASEAD